MPEHSYRLPPRPSWGQENRTAERRWVRWVTAWVGSTADSVEWITALSATFVALSALWSGCACGCGLESNIVRLPRKTSCFSPQLVVLQGCACTRSSSSSSSSSSNRISNKKISCSSGVPYIFPTRSRTERAFALNVLRIGREGRPT